jgi:hypothetical protein
MMVAAYLQNLVAELRLKGFGETSPKVILWSDSSAARSIAQRKGASIKHLSIKQLWIQSVVGSGRAELRKVASEVNEADFGSKALSIDRIRRLEQLLGYTAVLKYRTHGEERSTSKQRRATVGAKSASYLSIATLAAEATAALCEATTPTSKTGWEINVFDVMVFVFAFYGFIRCLLDLYIMATSRRKVSVDLEHHEPPPTLRERYYREVYITGGSSEVFHESATCQKTCEKLRICTKCYRRDVVTNMEASNIERSMSSTTPKARRDAGK